MNTIELVGPARSNSQTRLEEITRALLYEGYALFLYHRTAIKNVKPVPFGIVYPEGYQALHPEASAVMQTECVVKGHGRDDLAVHARVRFLQLSSRKLQEWTDADAFRDVDSLKIGDEMHLAGWQGIECEVQPEFPALWRCAADWSGHRIEFPEHQESRLLYNEEGRIVGRQIDFAAALTGRVTMAYFPVERTEYCYQLTVRIGNTTPVADAGMLSRDEVANWSFLSTHTILTVTGGEFVSVLEPDDEWKQVAAQCRNVGTWPVLIDQDNSTVLSSPIILHDYPEIAPQSRGDLFDSSEIEEALILHLAAMSDGEKETLARSDDRLRSMLERVSQVTPQEILNLHGVLRGVETTESIKL